MSPRQMLARGDRLGPYETMEAIGAGGMGEVWKTRDTRLDRIAAIRISKDRFSGRFEREARAVAALNHPHICQLYAVGPNYDVAPNYPVMEYIEGSALAGAGDSVRVTMPLNFFDELRRKLP